MKGKKSFKGIHKYWQWCTALLLVFMIVLPGMQYAIAVGNQNNVRESELKISGSGTSTGAVMKVPVSLNHDWNFVNTITLPSIKYGRTEVKDENAVGITFMMSSLDDCEMGATYI